jgi:signal transduction histidine kinase
LTVRKSLTARTLLVSAVLAVVLAAGFALLVIAIGSLRDAGRSALRAQQAVTAGTQLERSVVALESGLRGYVATGRDRDLEPFTLARIQYPRQVTRLQALAVGDESLSADVAAVSRQITDYVNLWVIPLLETTRERPAVGRALLSDRKGRERIAGIRQAFDHMFTRARSSAAAKERRADRRSDLAVTMGIIGIVLVAFGAVGATLLLRRGILRPIRSVAGASETLAAGDLSARVPDDRHDELGDLARAFNAMADSLEKQQRELASRAAELEQSNRELEDYASVTAHDLQGPLVTMSMYAGLLAQRVEGEDRKLAEHIRDGTATMRRLVRDLLGYARLERVPGRQDRVELDTVVQRALDSLAGPLQDAGAQVSVDPLPAVTGDADRLQQLVQNLLTNAIKFTDGIPRIEISGRAETASEARISVRDHGIGFQPGQAELIFRPFQRLHSPDRFEGSGIGLAVCQKIVEQHRGRIWADGRPGRGATFHFTVPLAVSDETSPDANLVGAGRLPT